MFALAVLACRLLSGQEYSFRYFGVAEGLTNLAVRQIYEDRTGFLWVSTENGIFRYDGERFEEFGPAQGIPATSGAAFGDAPDGSLLVGGNFGLYRLLGNRFEKIPLPGTEVSWAQGIQSDGKGHTFIGTDSGLMEFSAAAGPGAFAMQRFPRVTGTSGPEAAGVFVDGDIVWYGCGLELCRMDPKGTTILGRESGLPDRVWLVIRKDAEGNLWLRGKNAGVFELPRGQTVFRRPASPVPAAALIGVPAVDEDGRMLFPSPDGLLIRQQKRSDAASHGDWQKIGRPAGLRGTVYAAFEDRQHSLWIGLAGRGLARWRGYSEWASYTAASGLASDIVYEILPLADHSLWVGTEGGLFHGLRSGSGISWKKASAVGDVPVHAVRLAPGSVDGQGGDIWIGTETHGAARIDPATGAVEWFGEQQGLIGKAPYTIRFDRSRRLWAATEEGLFVARPPWRRFSRVSELPSARFWTVAEAADGAIWAGGSGGLFVYTSGRWNTFTRAAGLSNDEVISLGPGPRGDMWVGYRFGGGIDRARMHDGRLSIERAVQRKGSDGIAYFLEFDTLGRLWAGTERGVDVWDGGRWSHYDTGDGLAWDDCNLNAFAAEADGTVWIGTSGGLSRFRPRPRASAVIPPKVVFTKLLMGQLDVSGRQNPSVGIRSNALTARYSVLNAVRENSVVFRYRLTPARSAWTETTQRELEFAELAPGAYRLQVEARDSQGAWSGNRGDFPFEILTPWYRTWWFIGVCLLTPLLAAALVLRIRMLSAMKRERDLVRIVEEKTLGLRQANEELLRLSSIDPLTGLANRRVFARTMEQECARLSRTGSPLSLVFVDVDHFKALNDSQGHQRGDECLAAVGAELRRLARPQIDVAARYGGEEFAWILPETNPAAAARLAESLRLAIAALALPHPASPVAPVLTVSVGTATGTPLWCSTPGELIAAADRALYLAKRTGRNRVEVAAWQNSPNDEPSQTGSSLAILDQALRFTASPVSQTPAPPAPLPI